MPIDAYAGETHFADHLAPVFRALADPGDFVVESAMFERGAIRTDGWPAYVTTATDTTRPVLVASYGDVKRARLSGRTSIIRFEHGAGQAYQGVKHGSYAGGDDHDGVGLFLVPNHYSAQKWQERYPNAKVEVVGSPRLDALPRKDPAEPQTVAISFHWDCHIVPETLSAFGHFRVALEPLRDAYNLIGHGHPRAYRDRAPFLERRYRRAGIEAVESFEEVCRRADLYICDNSSTIYEFAATGRPVVVLNGPTYRKDVQHGLRFWDCIPGPQVDDPKHLISTVAEALRDGPQQRQQREKALETVYPYRSGAAQRAADVVAEWVAAERIAA